MKAGIVPFIAAVCLVASSAGCSDQPPTAPASSAALAAAGSDAAADVSAPVEVRTLPAPGNIVPGAQSTLVRNDAGVRMTIRTSQLEPGAAFTVWWVIFNNPGACVNGCDASDLGVPAVGGSQVFATGHVVPPTGVGNFAAHLRVGDTSGVVSGPGLLDARGAEIHIVVRSHGAPIPGLVDDQISTLGGGCGINVCGNRQFAAHHP